MQKSVLWLKRASLNVYLRLNSLVVRLFCADKLLGVL